MADEDGNSIGLADLLIELRTELDRAGQHLADAARAPLLDVDGAEVEIGFEVERTTKGKAGLRVHFVEAGGEHSLGSTATHRLKLKLKPALGTTVHAAGRGDGDELPERPPGSHS